MEQLELNPDLYSPEQGKEFLVTKGYTPDQWEAWTRDTQPSHELGAMAFIAKSEEPQSLVRVFQTLYPDEPNRWPEARTLADIMAEGESDRAWGKWPKAS